MPTQEEYEAAGRLTNPNAGGDCPAATCSMLPCPVTVKVEEISDEYTFEPFPNGTQRFCDLLTECLYQGYAVEIIPSSNAKIEPRR